MLKFIKSLLKAEQRVSDEELIALVKNITQYEGKVSISETKNTIHIVQRGLSPNNRIVWMSVCSPGRACHPDPCFHFDQTPNRAVLKALLSLPGNREAFIKWNKSNQQYNHEMDL